jgi:hypothetical protein
MRALLARDNDTSPALYHRLRYRYRCILDRVNADRVKPGLEVQGGKEANVPFAKCDKGRKDEKGVCREVVRLERIPVEEGPEECAGR